jgi:hypothetical protein
LINQAPTMLEISTAPHIKKFVDHKFGNPVRLHNRTTSHIILRALLFQVGQLAFFHNKENKHRILPCTVYIERPSRHDLNTPHITAKRQLINQFFENLFMEEMKAWIDQHAPNPHRNDRSDNNLVKQIEKFCLQFKIIIDEDVAQDTVVKMFYRYRKWIANCPLYAEQQPATLKDAIL